MTNYLVITRRAGVENSRPAIFLKAAFQFFSGVAFFLCVALTPAFAVQEDVPAPSLSIELNEIEYGMSEEVYVTVTLKNNHTEEQRYLLYDAPSKDHHVYSHITVELIENSKINKDQFLRYFPLQETYVSGEVPWVGKYVAPGESATYTIPLKKTLARQFPGLQFQPVKYSIRLVYSLEEVEEMAKNIGYWVGSAKSNQVSFYVTERKKLTKNEVIDIAKDAVKEIKIPTDTPIKVNLVKGKYIVTFVYERPKDRAAPGPNYYAQVRIEASSGKVVKVFVGS